MVLVDRLEQVISSVVDTGDDLGVTFGVGGPNNDDLVEVVLTLELANVGTDLVDVSSLGVTGKGVVSTLLLVLSDKVRVVDGSERLHLGHVRSNLTLKIIVENLGTSHSLVHGQTRDIPTTKHKVVRMNHGQDVGERNPDILTGSRVGTETDGGSTNERSVVVGHLESVLVVPSDVVLVGKDGSGDGGTVVTTPTDHHETGARKLAFGLELVLTLDGSSNVLGGAIVVVDLFNVSVEVLVVGGDGLGSVLNLVRVDSDELALLVTSIGRVDGHVGAIAVGSMAIDGIVSVSDRSHCWKQ